MRVFDPAHDRDHRDDHAAHQQDLADRDADHREGYAHGDEQRQDRRAGKVDLFAGGRNLGVEWAHERYSAATMNVRPNMNMQIPAIIIPARMFFWARRRSMTT